ncbi:MAG: hypothetical protein C0484_19355 [Rhodospirillum sp.]|nr:hypothetical protein [Rhodospirillum sp.]
MNRIVLFGTVAALCGLALGVPEAEARRISVLHGAMDICQAIDGGHTEVSEGVETCCATETAQYDDGIEIYGDDYCVVCVQGTETCYLEEGKARTLTPNQVKKLLKSKQKQGTILSN